MGSSTKLRGNAINRNVPDLDSRFRGNDKRESVFWLQLAKLIKSHPQILSKNPKSKPLANFCTAIPTHNIAVGWADFEGPCCHPDRPPAPAPALKRLKTQRIEPQPRQSGDWRSQEGVFFWGDDLQNSVKELPKRNIQNDSPDSVAVYPILFQEAHWSISAIGGGDRNAKDQGEERKSQHSSSPPYAEFSEPSGPARRRSHTKILHGTVLSQTGKNPI